MKLNSPILLVHGWSSGPSVWSRLTDPEHDNLHQPDFSTIQKPADFRPAVNAALPDHPTVVIGWSMGGMLAIETAVQHPESVKALVLIGATPKFISPNRQLGWPERILSRMIDQLKEEPEDVVLGFIHQMFAPTEYDDRPDYEELFHSISSTNFELPGLVAGLEYLRDTDLTEMLAKIQCPVLWLHGYDDPICPPDALNEIPESHQRVIIPDAGHLPHWTRAGEVRWMIEEFCRDIEGK